MTKLGTFIVIEGIDGAGTTTQSNLLTQKFQAQGLPVLQTAEPSAGPIGMMIRSILTRRMTLPAVEDGVNQRGLALLFAADRLDHLNTVIGPALVAGTHVICDRYSPSTYAYQGIGVGDDQWLGEVDSAAPFPDILIYLKISAHDALARINNRGETKEIFEKEEFLQQVVDRYDTYIEVEERVRNSKVLIVKATLEPEMIAQMIWHDNKEFITT